MHGSAGYAAIAVGFAKRLRATRAAAAAPNSNTIGGAGTGAGWPPLDPVLPELLALVLLALLDALDPLELPDDPLLPDDPELPDEPLLPLELQPPVEFQPLEPQPWLLDP